MNTNKYFLSLLTLSNFSYQVFGEGRPLISSHYTYRRCFSSSGLSSIFAVQENFVSWCNKCFITELLNNNGETARRYRFLFAFGQFKCEILQSR